MREKLFHRDFTLVVIGQIISLLGNAVLRFVLPLYLLDVTGSRSLFGLCSAAAFVPMVVLTPLGGVVADRLHKQRIMVVLDFFTCALVALTALALGHLPLVPVLVAAMMLLYGISGAYQPAVQASMPLLCPPDRLVDGNAVINQVSALSSLLGPLLGSLVYGAFGVTPVLAGASACFFASAVMELFIQIPHTPRHTGASVWQTARADLAESGTFLRQERPEILKYIALVSAFNLLLSALLVVSMPVLIKQTLGLGDTWYGLNQTAMAAGSLAGGLTAGLLGPRLTVRRSWLTLLACGVCLIPMGLCLLAGVGGCRGLCCADGCGLRSDGLRRAVHRDHAGPHSGSDAGHAGGEGGVSAADRLPMRPAGGAGSLRGPVGAAGRGRGLGAAGRGLRGHDRRCGGPAGGLLCRLRLQQMHGGDLVGHPFLGGAVLQDLAVGPALDPAFQAERVPHLEPGRLDRQLSPGDHRQIVRPAVPAAHRQHQVADAAAQRGAAEDGGACTGRRRAECGCRALRTRVPWPGHTPSAPADSQRRSGC